GPGLALHLRLLDRNNIHCLVGSGLSVRPYAVSAFVPDGPALVTPRSPAVTPNVPRASTAEAHRSASGDNHQRSASVKAELMRQRLRGRVLVKDHSDADGPRVSKPGQGVSSGSSARPNHPARGKAPVALSIFLSRPPSVGSHYHFTETNKYLVFDRRKAYGMRLNIPAGTSIRFEPGDERSVPLVEIAGFQIVRGGNNLCDGKVDANNLPQIMKRVHAKGFGHLKQKTVQQGKPHTMTKANYISHFGPTVGDKVKLADTCLVVEVEKDYTSYGDEVKFGGGKVIRDGMGQACYRRSEDVLDLVITNALIIDAVLGIVKADVGIKGNTIVGIGKSGNPDVMAGVDPCLVIGCSTEVVAGEGLILTAGAIDTHVHYVCPQISKSAHFWSQQAIAGGITTLIGGGSGPAAGTRATTCSPGPECIEGHIAITKLKPNPRMLEPHAETSTENIAAGATGQTMPASEAVSNRNPMGRERQRRRIIWPVAPAAIVSVLIAACGWSVWSLGFNFVNAICPLKSIIKKLIKIFLHLHYKTGEGMTQFSDKMSICSPHALFTHFCTPSGMKGTSWKNSMSTKLVRCACWFPLFRNIKEDLSFAESRIRAETIAAEDVLHDIGAISIYTSDALAMGRIGEVVSRTWQTADKMRLVRGKLDEDSLNNDNFRVKRYIAKYTINPALAHGIDSYVGSVEPGKMADLVLWKPALFGAKPEMVIKGGQAISAQIGQANGSIPNAEPIIMRKMFGACGISTGKNSAVFVSRASLNKGIVQKYGVKKTFLPVFGSRKIKKSDFVLNGMTPKLSVDPEKYLVEWIKEEDGKEKRVHLTVPPSDNIALAQTYFLF
ncbi:unnamed protein product, partial [Ixodes hexagonus]